jgi:hypothetical protein
MKFVESPLKLELSTHEVSDGDNYTVHIKPLTDAPVRLAYTLNDGPLEVFSAAFADGMASFGVFHHTKRGMYRFLAFKVSDADEWIRTDQTILVR